MINVKNTKQIKISYHTVGAFGILNFDSSDQKYAYTKASNTTSKEALFRGGKDNMRFGKAVFSKSDGKLVRTNVISDNAIKQAVFNSDCPYASSEIWYKPASFILDYITSPVMLMKGYLGCTDDSIRRKSMLTFTCAKMCDQTIPVMQMNTTKKQIPDATSLVIAETCGDTEWHGDVLVNVGNGENFINYTQAAPKTVSEPEYEVAIRKAFGNMNLTVTDYTRKTALDSPSERGVLLSGTDVAKMVNILTDRIREMTRESRGASLGQVVIDGIFVRGVVDGMDPDANGWCHVSADSVFGCIEPREVYRASTADEVNAANAALKAQTAKAQAKKKAKNPSDAKTPETTTGSI